MEVSFLGNGNRIHFWSHSLEMGGEKLKLLYKYILSHFSSLLIKTGRQIFGCLGDKVTLFLSYANQGSSFVYGYLVTGKPFNLEGKSNLTGVNETAVEIAEIFNTQGYFNGNRRCQNQLKQCCDNSCVVVMGPGQLFVARVGSAIFGLGLENFPQKSQIFQFFPLRSRKSLWVR